MNCVVSPRSRHPGLVEYIDKALNTAREFIQADAVRKVVLCILDGSDVAERFVFDVCRVSHALGLCPRHT